MHGMTRRVTIAVAGILMASTALVGCAVASVPQAAPAPSATPTPTTLPAVSTRTTCTLLFGTDMNGPINKTVDIIGRFVDSPDISTVTSVELSEVISELETAKASAASDLQPYIEAQVTPMRELLAAKRGTATNGTVKFDEYKAAGLELITRCRSYL